MSKIAIQMDPIELIDIKADTTFALALEAQKRKHNISFFKPEDLILRYNDVLANICRLELSSSNNLNQFPMHLKSIWLCHYHHVIYRALDARYR